MNQPHVLAEIAALKEARQATPAGPLVKPGVDVNNRVRSAIFEEQENQIESDRKQISRLNKTIEEMRRQQADSAVTIDELKQHQVSMNTDYNELAMRNQTLQASNAALKQQVKQAALLQQQMNHLQQLDFEDGNDAASLGGTDLILLTS